MIKKKTKVLCKELFFFYCFVYHTFANIWTVKICFVFYKCDKIVFNLVQGEKYEN